MQATPSMNHRREIGGKEATKVTIMRAGMDVQFENRKDKSLEKHSL